MTARRTLDGAMTEAELQTAVVDCAHQYGWLVAHFRPAQTGRGWRTPMQGDKGFPDLVLARRGEVLFVELKREGQDPSPDQAKWLAWVDPPGLVWRPSDWSSGSVRAYLAADRRN